MELFSPLYYEKFRCIADRCRHSCCVGWEISVDGDTLAKYRRFGREDILKHLSVDGDFCEINLREDGRCPFLDERGLCEIISGLGDDYTSEICREHPRFYHRIGDVCEVGLGAVCEEAARLILTENDFSAIRPLGDYRKTAADETDFDTLSHRAEIYARLSDVELSYRERVWEIAEKYGVSERLREDFSEAFSELEYLEEENLRLFEVGGEERRPWVQEYALRFFAYLIFRHASISTDEVNLRARVGFCLLLLGMLENATAKNEALTDEDVFDLVRRISSEIEYSEENTSLLIFEFESAL